MDNMTDRSHQSQKALLQMPDQTNLLSKNSVRLDQDES